MAIYIVDYQKGNRSLQQIKVRAKSWAEAIKKAKGHLGNVTVHGATPIITNESEETVKYMRGKGETILDSAIEFLSTKVNDEESKFNKGDKFRNKNGEEIRIEKVEILPNKGMVLVDYVYKNDKKGVLSTGKTPQITIEKTIKQGGFTKDATNIIAQKNGYILAVNNQGTVVLAFPGEDPNSNPHMYLGKADKPGNIEEAKRIFNKFAAIGSKDAKSMKLVTDGKTYNYENPRSPSFIFSNFMAVAKSGDTLNIKFKGNLITINKRQGGDYSITYGNIKKSGTDTQIMSILKDLQSTKDTALRIDPITGFLVR